MSLKLPWAQKRMLQAFEKSISQFFADFWVTKLKPFSEKVEERIQSYLNKNLVSRSFLENGFEATLSSKRNIVSLWKGHFTVFCKFLRDPVEITFRESEAKRPKLFKSKFGHQKFLRKWFWSYLELKKEYCEPLERTFYSFLQVSAWPSWNHFQGKWSKASETI